MAMSLSSSTTTDMLSDTESLLALGFGMARGLLDIRKPELSLLLGKLLNKAKRGFMFCKRGLEEFNEAKKEWREYQQQRKEQKYENEEMEQMELEYKDLEEAVKDFTFKFMEQLKDFFTKVIADCGDIAKQCSMKFLEFALSVAEKIGYLGWKVLKAIGWYKEEEGKQSKKSANEE